MIDFDKPLRSSDNAEVEVLRGVKPGLDYGVVLLHHDNYTRAGICRRCNGLVFFGCRGGGNIIGPRLKNVPQRIKQKRWINIYTDDKFGGCYPTRSKAGRFALPGRAACVEIEIDCEEGEGL